eukprot:scaffold41617_cov75-Cyclotella_meneghiniana.AAC.3
MNQIQQRWSEEWQRRISFISKLKHGPSEEDIYELLGVVKKVTFEPRLHKEGEDDLNDELDAINPTNNVSMDAQSTTRPRPNANIRYTAGVITASTSANFAPPSLTPPNTNISDSSTSAGRFSTNSASALTPQHPIIRDDDGGGIVPDFDW